MHFPRMIDRRSFSSKSKPFCKWKLSGWGRWSGSPILRWEPNQTKVSEPTILFMRMLSFSHLKVRIVGPNCRRKWKLFQPRRPLIGNLISGSHLSNLRGVLSKESYIELSPIKDGYNAEAHGYVFKILLLPMELWDPTGWRLEHVW